MYLWLWLVVHRSRYPYIEAEVRYAAREYACTAADVLARRTRLAFLNRSATADAPTCGCMNLPHLCACGCVRVALYRGVVGHSEAARDAVPRVVDIMAAELGWDAEYQAAERQRCLEYLATFAGPIPDKEGARIREATMEDLRDVFKRIDTDGSGWLSADEVMAAASDLGFTLKKKELRKVRHAAGVRVVVACNRG